MTLQLNGLSPALSKGSIMFQSAHADATHCSSLGAEFLGQAIGTGLPGAIRLADGPSLIHRLA